MHDMLSPANLGIPDYLLQIKSRILDRNHMWEKMSYASASKPCAHIWGRPRVHMQTRNGKSIEACYCPNPTNDVQSYLLYFYHMGGWSMGRWVGRKNHVLFVCWHSTKRTLGFENITNALCCAHWLVGLWNCAIWQTLAQTNKLGQGTN